MQEISHTSEFPSVITLNSFTLFSLELAFQLGNFLGDNLGPLWIFIL